MLVQATTRCWVVGSFTTAAVDLSLSARRDSGRASRSSAVTTFAEGGSGWSSSLLVTPSLYQWAGGSDAVRRLIDSFYDRVEHDELIAPLFPGGGYT